MNTELPSKAFEKLAAAVQQYLDPESTVSHDVHVTGVRSGKMRQIDVAVRGRVGSKSVLVVVECRHYSRPIDVAKIDAFVGFLDDVQASAGIMVTTVGYSDAALERAAAEGIETWVLRPVRDEDWHGYIRSVQTTISLRGVVYRNCQIELATGEVIGASPNTVLYHPGSSPPMAIFEHVMNHVREQHGFKEGERLSVLVGEPLFVGDSADANKQVKFLSAVPQTEELLQRQMVTRAPQDWVFRRYRPGDVESERTFLVISRLKELAAKLPTS